MFLLFLLMQTEFFCWFIRLSSFNPYWFYIIFFFFNHRTEKWRESEDNLRRSSLHWGPNYFPRDGGIWEQRNACLSATCFSVSRQSKIIRVSKLYSTVYGCINWMLVSFDDYLFIKAFIHISCILQYLIQNVISVSWSFKLVSSNWCPCKPRLHRISRRNFKLPVQSVGV